MTDVLSFFDPVYVGKVGVGYIWGGIFFGVSCCGVGAGCAGVHLVPRLLIGVMQIG